MPSLTQTYRPSAERITAAVLLGVHLLWILSLPAWPSQDGPVHLFYSHVLAQLLHGSGSVYSNYFAIKHLLPPYALYYYLLIVLSRVVPPLLADRIVICAYLLVFLTGFHALATALAPGSRKGPDRATLLATILLLNWPLGMGFVNYCLSLALSLWALALWFRPRPEGRQRRTRLAFLVLVGVITLTHPVPLLTVLGIAGLDLVTRPFRQRPDRPGIPRADLITYLIAALPLLYVTVFASPHLLAQRTREAGPFHRALARVVGYAQGKSLSLLFGAAHGVELYRAALLGVLLVALAAASHQFLRNRRQGVLTLPDLFLGVAVLLLILLPWLPSDISGAYFFPERLVLVAWIFALLAAAGWEAASPQATPALIVFTSVVVAVLLLSANTALRPLARQAQTLEHASLVDAGEVVLSLESTSIPPTPRIVPSWNPEYWMGVHTIRGNDAVLANAPWLDSSIIPLAAKAALPASRLDPQIANAPSALTGLIRRDAELAKTLFSSAGAVALTPASRQAATVPDAVLTETGVNPGNWRCSKSADGSEQVCREVR